MKRADVLAEYRHHSERTSEKVRQLAFAALGVVWIFRPNDTLTLPAELFRAGTAAVIALALDFTHSLFGTGVWGWVHRTKELTGVSASDEFRMKAWINWPANSLFVLKVVALFVSYLYLLGYMVERLG